MGPQKGNRYLMHRFGSAAHGLGVSGSWVAAGMDVSRSARVAKEARIESCVRDSCAENDSRDVVTTATLRKRGAPGSASLTTREKGPVADVLEGACGRQLVLLRTAQSLGVQDALIAGLTLDGAREPEQTTMRALAGGHN